MKRYEAPVFHIVQIEDKEVFSLDFSESGTGETGPGSDGNGLAQELGVN
ncbi:hypothetical protein [Olsenella sp. An285]|nr:hypothetical protein [Olsenella sp. An285]